MVLIDTVMANDDEMRKDDDKRQKFVKMTKTEKSIYIVIKVH